MFKLCFPVRFLLLFLCMSAACVTYLNRSNINVTIIAMANSTEVKEKNSVSDICPFPEGHFNKTIDTGSDFEHPLQFQWDQSDQGVILGAFFYPYIIFQVPSGIAVQKFGGKWIVITSLLGSGIINLLTPILASNFYLMVTSRVVLGTIQAGTYPAIFAIICNWMPTRNRSFAFAVIESGGHLGSILTTSLSGFLSEHTQMGWPLVFYVSGAVATAYAVIFFFTITNTPRESTLATLDEVHMIESDVNSQTCDEPNKMKTPWIGILTSRAVLSCIISKFAGGWTFFTLGSKLPTYLSDFIHVELTENGVLNSTMYIMAIISGISVGVISEKIIEQKWTTRTNIRKIFSATALIGMAASMVSIPSTGCSELGLMILVLFAWVFMEFNAGGDKPLPAEMTKNFPAVTYAYINAASMITGFIAPWAVGLILKKSPDLVTGWSIIFYTSGGICIVALLFVITCFSAERQPFDYDQEELLDPKLEATRL